MRFLVFRFGIFVFGSDFWFSDSGFFFWGPIYGFPIEDSRFWVRFYVFRCRIQVFGCDFGFSDSGDRFLGPIWRLSEILKLKELPNDGLETSWGALWLGIRTFFDFNVLARQNARSD